MQTLEQIVNEAIHQAGKFGIAYAFYNNDNYGSAAKQDETLDKLAKLREDTIRQVEEYVEHEIDVVLGNN